MPLPLIHYLYPSGISKFLRYNSDKEPSWALITGATDGIGRALCFELSARGFNIVLHGRNADKLARVKAELQTKNPQRKFLTIAVDASSFQAADINKIAAQVVNLPLTILINNVGGTGPLSSNFKPFEDTTPAEMQALMSLNFLFPLQLTAAILPQLQRQNAPTAILTCGSQSAIGQPYVATYGATKGAQHTWMRALNAEQRHAKSKVEVLELVVGATYTQQFEADKNFKPSLFMPTAEIMAKSIVDRAGNGHQSVHGYFWHSLQTHFLYSLLPNAWSDSIVAGILGPSVERKKD